MVTVWNGIVIASEFWKWEPPFWCRERGKCHLITRVWFALDLVGRKVVLDLGKYFLIE